MTNRLNPRVILCLFSALAILSSAVNSSNAAKPKAVLIIADKLLAEDLFGDLDNPVFPANFFGMQSSCFIGLLGPNHAGQRSEFTQYATVSAGSASRADLGVGEGYSAGELVEGTTAAVVFKRRTGIDPKSAAVLHLYSGPLQKINEKLYNPSLPGYLGERLNKSGIKIAVFGNSDLQDRHYRPAVAIAMDKNGIVPEGDVSAKCLSKNPYSPAGIQSNESFLFEKTSAALKSCDLVVIDFGDSTRFDLVRLQLSESAAKVYKQALVSRLRSFASRLWRENSDLERLYVVSLTPPISPDSIWDSLTPVLVVNKKGGKSGEISSENTRSWGLVTAVDLCASILETFGIYDTAISGRPFVFRQNEKAFQNLKWRDARSRLNERAIFPILMGIAVFGAMVVTAAAAVVAFGLQASPYFIGFLKFVLLCFAACPIGLLVEPSFRSETIARATVVIIFTAFIAALIVFLAAKYLSKRLYYSSQDFSMPFLLAATALFIIFAGISGIGMPNILFSIVMGSPVAGMRYYGLGNESMGLMIGCLLVSSMIFNKAFSYAKLSIIFTLAIYLLAFLSLAPPFGSNTGGMITAVVTFSLGFMAIIGKKINPKRIALAITAGLVIAFLTGFLELKSQTGTQSHLGRVIGSTLDNRMQLAAYMAARKFLYNFILLDTKQAATALLVFSPFFVLWLSGAKEKIVSFLNTDLRLKQGFVAGLIGAAVSLLTNDSGIVSAFLIFASMVVFLLHNALLNWREPAVHAECRKIKQNE